MDCFKIIIIQLSKLVLATNFVFHAAVIIIPRS